MNRSSLPSAGWLLDHTIAPSAQNVIHVHEEVLPLLGRVRAGSSARGICFIDLVPGARHQLQRDGAVESRFPGFTIKHAPQPLNELFRQLREYVVRKRRTFDLEIDLGFQTRFTQRVLASTAKIPFGATVTYGALARRVGNPGAARAIGGAMSRNPVPIIIPCHRVLSSTGLGGFTGGLELKRNLLSLEGFPLE